MRLLLAAVLLAVSPALWGSMIYDSGTPITDPTSDCSSLCPDLVTSIGRGAFTLQADSVLTGIQFWTFDSPGSYHGGSLGWQIYLDDLGNPGPLIGSGAFTLSPSSMGTVSVAGYQTEEFGTNISVNNLAIHPPASPQGYFLDIFDNSGQDSFGIFWSTSGQDILSFQLFGSGNTLPEQVVPEASTFLLVGAGLACVALQRLRRRSSIQS